MQSHKQLHLSTITLLTAARTSLAAESNEMQINFAIVVAYRYILEQRVSLTIIKSKSRHRLSRSSHASTIIDNAKYTFKGLLWYPFFIFGIVYIIRASFLYFYKFL